MKGTVVIELALDHTPDSGSGLPDIGHVAYDLRKHIEQYVWTSKKTGEVWRLNEHWRVVRLVAEAHD